MSHIVDESVENYLQGLIPDRDEVLREMEEQAAKEKIPIVGPLVGRLLWQLCRVAGARRVLELGSAIGYSTIWLARGVGEEGSVIFTDWGEENARTAKGYFERAGLLGRIDVRTGDSLEILDQLDGEFDLIFNDVDKQFYPTVFEKAVPRLRRGGLLVCDNVLWSGKVTEAGADEWTEAIRKYNRLIHETPGVFSTILPLRDGIGITMKEA
ncbi:MAG: O-methyltransferase [Planctomycetota bacterium]|nr:O-methyltransferase [Planctomycetota bacterium]